MISNEAIKAETTIKESKGGSKIIKNKTKKNHKKINKTKRLTRKFKH